MKIVKLTATKQDTLNEAQLHCRSTVNTSYRSADCQNTAIRLASHSPLTLRTFLPLLRYLPYPPELQILVPSTCAYHITRGANRAP